MNAVTSLPSLRASTDRVVAGDDAAVFELLDALDHRGRRQSDLLAELDQRDPAVLLQQGDNLQVDGIEFGGISAEFHKVILVESR